jgi:dipeptide transport system ATP-binding protein
MKLLEVEDLKVSFVSRQGRAQVVDGLDIRLETGETLAIVGESGSGKSVASLAIMGLIESPGEVQARQILFQGRDLQAMPARQRRTVLGKQLSMIFQDPGSSLNPCYTIGVQIDEVLKVHTGINGKARRQRAIELLEAVGIPDPASRLKAWPHQLSGGMNQRVMIAIAIACHPALLIADEPTTALDVTIQAQIMRLLKSLGRNRDMAMILISHDLGVVAEAVDRVLVLYAGQLVESATKDKLFAQPRHPYTQALMKSIPSGRRQDHQRLPVIPGQVPLPGAYPQGCRFHPRCRYADDKCRLQAPPLVTDGCRSVRCFYPLAEIAV